MKASTMRRAMREIEPHQVTTGQIARRVGCKPDTAGYWAGLPGFPRVFNSIGDEKDTRVWLDFEVMDWLIATGRTEYAAIWQDKI